MTTIHKRRRNTTAAWLFLALSLCAMAVFGQRLREDWQIFREGGESYERLISSVRPGRPFTLGPSQTDWTNNEGYEQPAGYANYGSPAVINMYELSTGGDGGHLDGMRITDGNREQATNEARADMAVGVVSSDRPAAFYTPKTPSGHMGEKIKIPDMDIDFAALQAINPDAAAWLYSPDTAIDYPVMRAKDYDHYLHYLPDGTYNANGSLFIDYNWVDFSDRLTVVYGHNMKSGRMFGTLTNYKKQAYFDEHPFLYLYTPEGENYRIDLLYGCVIGAGQWRERAFMFKENVDALVAYADHYTTFRSDAQYGEDDRFIALSTCSYEFDDARYVVIGVLRPEILSAAGPS